MKVKDIIKLTAKLLCETDILECVEYCEKNEKTFAQLLALLNQSVASDDESYIPIPNCLNSQSEKNLRIILDCINIAYLHICTEKYLLYKTESITVTNNCFDIDNLSQKLFKIKDITNAYGYVKIKLDAKKILLPNGTYTIKYAYLPQELNFDDEINSFNGKLTLLALSYGVCGKFCLIKNLFEEAESWESKFEKSLTQSFKKIGEIKIKSRRWI